MSIYRPPKVVNISVLVCECINLSLFLHLRLCLFMCVCASAMASGRAQSVCAEHVTPYLSSVLEELLEPVNGGFHAVRQLCEERLERLCRDVHQGGTFQQVQQVRDRTGKENGTTYTEIVTAGVMLEE